MDRDDNVEVRDKAICESVQTTGLEDAFELYDVKNIIYILSKPFLPLRV